ncbi:hypothetical protein COB55_01865 [Candidatus Wolfebacteria bacterium]|nr:MAG: hypothetical protein COB55_01865 [Candidatus Wolfebacteria bacterium]
MKFSKGFGLVVAVVFAAGLVFPSQALAITQAQINAIVSLLASFDAPADSIVSVRATLEGKPDPTLTTNGNSVTYRTASFSGVSERLDLELADNAGSSVYVTEGQDFGLTGGDGEENVALYNNSSIPCTIFTRTLYRGLKDTPTKKDVSELQQILKDMGHYTYPSITGYFGVKTIEAVKAFQIAEGIVKEGERNVTGFGGVGPVTGRAILNACIKRFNNTYGRVSPTTDSQVSTVNESGSDGVSSSAYAPRPRIIITSPLNRSYRPGSKVIIRWTGQNVPENKFVIYRRDSNGKKAFQTGRHNKYSYVYTVPTVKGAYSIGVCDSNGNSCNWTRTFFVSGEAVADKVNVKVPEITVIQPNGREVFVAGRTYEIKWVETDAYNLSYFYITYKNIDTGTVKNLARGVNGTSYKWTIPEDIVAGRYIVTINQLNQDPSTPATRSDSSNSSFTITAPASSGKEGVVEKSTSTTLNPSIRITSSNIDSSHNPGENIYFYWVNNELSSKTFKIYLRNINTGSRSVIAQKEEINSYRYTIPNTSGSYQLGVCSDSSSVCAWTSAFGVQASQKEQLSSTVDLSFSDSSNNRKTVASGGSTTIKWNTTNVTTCTRTDSWGGTYGGSGSYSTGNLTNTTGSTITRKYGISCSGGYGTVADAVYIHIEPQVVVEDKTVSGGSVIIKTIDTLSIYKPALIYRNVVQGERVYLNASATGADADSGRVKWSIVKDEVVVVDIVTNMKVEWGFSWVVPEGFTPGRYYVRVEDMNNPAVKNEVLIQVSAKTSALSTNDNVANPLSMWERLTGMWGR